MTTTMRKQMMQHKVAATYVHDSMRDLPITVLASVPGLLTPVFQFTLPTGSSGGFSSSP